MKANISLLLNAILLVAVIYLFTQLPGGEKSSETSTNSQVSASQNSSHGGSIVFVEYDSILFKYNMVSDMQEELLAERSRLESRLQTEVNKYRSEVQTFQERAPYFSERQRNIEQERLMAKEQEIMQLEQNLSMEFAQRQEALNLKLEQQLQDLFSSEEYKNQHVMIFGKGTGSNLLFADSTLNITQKVVEKLNSDYLLNNAK